MARTFLLALACLAAAFGPVHGFVATSLARIGSPHGASSSACRSAPPSPTRGLRPELRMSSAASPEGGEGPVDVALLAKWGGATVLQVATIAALLKGLDLGMAQASGLPELAPKALAFLLFGFMAVRSRAFSILDNSRPTKPSSADSDWNEVEVDSTESKKSLMADTIRPSWMPPPIAFPFIWSTIGVLRAIASVLVWEATGRTFFSVPLLAYGLHLSIGDTWNTINNVYQLKGTSAAGVCFVFASVWNAIYQYYQVDQTAGLVLAPSGVWLTVASVLIWTIWDLNGRDAFLPRADE